MGVEQHSCVVVRRLQCNGQSIAAILQKEKWRNRDIKEGKREKSEFIDPENMRKTFQVEERALQFKMDHVIIITHGCSFFQPLQHGLYYKIMAV